MADIRNQFTLCPIGTFGFCFGRCKFQVPNLCISGKFACLYYPGCVSRSSNQIRTKPARVNIPI